VTPALAVRILGAVAAERMPPSAVTELGEEERAAILRAACGALAADAARVGRCVSAYVGEEPAPAVYLPSTLLRRANRVAAPLRDARWNVGAELESVITPGARSASLTPTYLLNQYFLGRERCEALHEHDASQARACIERMLSPETSFVSPPPVRVEK
jgi:hypothetical protein